MDGISAVVRTELGGNSRCLLTMTASSRKDAENNENTQRNPDSAEEKGQENRRTFCDDAEILHRYLGCDDLYLVFMY